jgi:hypothetical protein
MVLAVAIDEAGAVAAVAGVDGVVRAAAAGEKKRSAADALTSVWRKPSCDGATWLPARGPSMLVPAAPPVAVAHLPGYLRHRVVDKLRAPIDVVGVAVAELVLDLHGREGILASNETGLRRLERHFLAPADPYSGGPHASRGTRRPTRPLRRPLSPPAPAQSARRGPQSSRGTAPRCAERSPPPAAPRERWRSASAARARCCRRSRSGNRMPGSGRWVPPLLDRPMGWQPHRTTSVAAHEVRRVAAELPLRANVRTNP